MDRSQFVKSILISILIVGYYSITLSQSAYSLFLVIVSLCGLIVALIPAIVFLINRKSENIFFFPIIFSTWLYFLKPFLNSKKISYPGRVMMESEFPIMSLVLLIGLIMLLIGFYSGFNNKVIKPLTSEKFKLKNKTLGNIAIIIIFINVLLNIIITIPLFRILLRSFLTVQNYVPTIVVALFVLYKLRKGNNLFFIIIFVVYLILQFFYFVGETLSSKLVLLLIGGFIGYVLETKKIPYKMAIITLFIFYPIYNSRFKYRHEAVKRWEGNATYQKSYIDIVKMGASISFDEVFNFDLGISHYEKREIIEKYQIDRMELVSHLSQCVYQVELNNKSLKWGSTFWWLPLAPIPRILFPFKPKNVMASTIAEDYGLKVKGNYASNFPIWSEFYINFGYLGIIFLAFFQGRLIKLILKKVAFGSGDLNLIIVFTILYPLIVIEGNITLMYGMVLSLMLFWWLLLKLLKFNNEQEF